MSIPKISILSANNAYTILNPAGGPNNGTVKQGDGTNLWQYNNGNNSDKASFDANDQSIRAVFMGDTGDTVNLTGGWQAAGYQTDESSGINGMVFKKGADTLLISGDTNLTGDFNGKVSAQVGVAPQTGGPTTPQASNDTFGSTGHIYNRMGDVRFVNGTYTGGDAAADTDADFQSVVAQNHKGTTTHGIVSTAWDALGSQFDAIDTDKSGLVNSEELFTALSNGTLAKGTDAYKAASIIANNSDLMNNLDKGGDTKATTQDSWFNKDDIAKMSTIAKSDSADAPVLGGPSTPAGPSADTFASDTHTYGRMQDARWVNGTYTGGDAAAATDANFQSVVSQAHKGTTTHGIIKSAWDALKAQFGAVDTDHNNLVNVEELFTAISNGTLAKGSDAYKAASLIVNDGDLANNLDKGSDTKATGDSMFNMDDLQKMSDLSVSDDK